MPTMGLLIDEGLGVQRAGDNGWASLRDVF